MTKWTEKQRKIAMKVRDYLIDHGYKDREETIQEIVKLVTQYLAQLDPAINGFSAVDLGIQEEKDDLIRQINKALSAL